MTASSPLPAPNLMPLMRYRDLAEAMGWLERAFGFEKQIAVSGNDGDVIYGQMTFRGSLIMMGAVRDTDLDKLMRQPDEVGGIETQSCYVVVEDADEHYARSVECGADVVLELKSDGLGRRGYSCRDPEGHIWSFGTYHPGKGLAVAGPADVPRGDFATPLRRKPRLLMGLAVLALGLGGAGALFATGLGTAAAKFAADASGRKFAADAEAAYAELVKVRSEKRDAEQKAESLSRDLEAARATTASTSAAQEIAELKHEKDAAEAARREAEAAATSLKSELQRVNNALNDAIKDKAAPMQSAASQDALSEAESARREAEAQARALKDELVRVKDALEDAVEAKRVSEEKLAVLSASVRSGAMEPNATKLPIETAATGPGIAVDADDDEIGRRVGKANKSLRPTKLRSKAAQERVKRLPPTYVVDLSDVPWPYSTWHK